MGSWYLKKKKYKRKKLRSDTFYIDKSLTSEYNLSYFFKAWTARFPFSDSLETFPNQTDGSNKNFPHMPIFWVFDLKMLEAW